MTVSTVDGFKVYEELNRRCVIIESDRIDACMDFYRSGNFDGIWINRIHGYVEDNIDFLERYPDLAHVEIMRKMRDLRSLQALRRLRYLLIAENDSLLDLSLFPELEVLRTEWSSKYKNFDGCKNLKILSLRKYKPRSRDLTELSSLKNLEQVDITQSPIVSLKGLAELERLQKLKLSYLSRFELIDEIANNAASLECLIFNNCRKIQNHSYVAALHNLRILAFNECGEMPSISFIKNMVSLKSFRFVDTNVLDGDMTPCVGLEYAGFFKKRHYSHSKEEIEALTRGAS